jgi:phage tail sheath protein FI
LNRGQIKNVVKLAYSPDKTDRDSLYKKGVNPVVSFPGEGTILFGDKTLLAKPSAFDRINVRRLFIVLEKAIAIAAKYQLFEFNDAFTRAQFRNLVEPFLRDIKGRRGVYDFRVICDETNNTGEIIDRNEFVADIYIKPARSINFITLNFVAVRTGVAFEEIVGA